MIYQYSKVNTKIMTEQIDKHLGGKKLGEGISRVVYKSAVDKSKVVGIERWQKSDIEMELYQKLGNLLNTLFPEHFQKSTLLEI
ncbi:MAG: hypothetical protein Fur0024_2930 [Patescibacteria group bacterium]